jgi:DNA-binding NarL/FixJ family response regulator
MAIKLLIADDHEVVRAGLRAFFEGSEIKIVAEASNGNTAYKLVNKSRPDLAILDIRMPEGDGLSCLTRIKSDRPNFPVIMFSAHDNPTYLARAFALGAAGYLSKQAPRKHVVDAIKAVAGGEVIWSKDDLRRITGALSAPDNTKDVEVALTKREGEVLKQLALGLTNREIARSLHISYETVKEHVQHILKKLGVSDRTQAAVWAVRKRLV